MAFSRYRISSSIGLDDTFADARNKPKLVVSGLLRIALHSILDNQAKLADMPDLEHQLGHLPHELADLLLQEACSSPLPTDARISLASAANTTLVFKLLELRSFETLCKRAHSVEHLKFTAAASIGHQLSLLANIGTHLQVLKVHSSSSGLLQARSGVLRTVVEAAPQLVKLHWGAGVCDDEDLDALQRLPRLTALGLHLRCYVQKLVFPNLRKLRLREHAIHEDAQVSLPQLQTLILDSLRIHTPALNLLLQSSAVTLQTLRLLNVTVHAEGNALGELQPSDGTGLFSSARAAPIQRGQFSFGGVRDQPLPTLQHCAQLRHLELLDCRCSYEPFVMQVAGPLLETLSVSGKGSNLNKSLVSERVLFPALRKLSCGFPVLFDNSALLAGGDKLTWVHLQLDDRKDPFKQLYKFANVETLVLECLNCVDEVACNVIYTCPKLTQLSVRKVSSGFSFRNASVAFTPTIPLPCTATLRHVRLHDITCTPGFLRDISSCPALETLSVVIPMSTIAFISFLPSPALRVLRLAHVDDSSGFSTTKTLPAMDAPLIISERVEDVAIAYKLTQESQATFMQSLSLSRNLHTLLLHSLHEAEGTFKRLPVFVALRKLLVIATVSTVQMRLALGACPRLEVLQTELETNAAPYGDPLTEQDGDAWPVEAMRTGANSGFLGRAKGGGLFANAGGPIFVGHRAASPTRQRFSSKDFDSYRPSNSNSSKPAVASGASLFGGTGSNSGSVGSFGGFASTKATAAAAAAAPTAATSGSLFGSAATGTGTATSNPFSGGQFSGSLFSSTANASAASGAASQGWLAGSAVPAASTAGRSLFGPVATTATATGGGRALFGSGSPVLAAATTSASTFSLSDLIVTKSPTLSTPARTVSFGASQSAALNSPFPPSAAAASNFVIPASWPAKAPPPAQADDNAGDTAVTAVTSDSAVTAAADASPSAQSVADLSEPPARSTIMAFDTPPTFAVNDRMSPLPEVGDSAVDERPASGDPSPAVLQMNSRREAPQADADSLTADLENADQQPLPYLQYVTGKTVNMLLPSIAKRAHRARRLSKQAISVFDLPLELPWASMTVDVASRLPVGANYPNLTDLTVEKACPAEIQQILKSFPQLRSLKFAQSLFGTTPVLELEHSSLTQLSMSCKDVMVTLHTPALQLLQVYDSQGVTVQNAWHVEQLCVEQCDDSVDIHCDRVRKAVYRDCTFTLPPQHMQHLRELVLSGAVNHGVLEFPCPHLAFVNIAGVLGQAELIISSDALVFVTITKSHFTSVTINSQSLFTLTCDDLPKLARFHLNTNSLSTATFVDVPLPEEACLQLANQPQMTLLKLFAVYVLTELRLTNVPRLTVLDLNQLPCMETLVVHAPNLSEISLGRFPALRTVDLHTPRLWSLSNGSTGLFGSFTTPKARAAAQEKCEFMHSVSLRGGLFKEVRLPAACRFSFADPPSHGFHVGIGTACDAQTLEDICALPLVEKITATTTASSLRIVNESLKSFVLMEISKSLRSLHLRCPSLKVLSTGASPLLADLMIHEGTPTTLEFDRSVPLSEESVLSVLKASGRVEFTSAASRTRLQLCAVAFNAQHMQLLNTLTHITQLSLSCDDLVDFDCRGLTNLKEVSLTAPRLRTIRIGALETLDLVGGDLDAQGFIDALQHLCTDVNASLCLNNVRFHGIVSPIPERTPQQPSETASEAGSADDCTTVHRPDYELLMQMCSCSDDVLRAITQAAVMVRMECCSGFSTLTATMARQQVELVELTSLRSVICSGASVSLTRCIRLESLVINSDAPALPVSITNSPRLCELQMHGNCLQQPIKLLLVNTAVTLECLQSIAEGMTGQLDVSHQSCPALTDQAIPGGKIKLAQIPFQ